ncbi:MAG: hypothetical protein M9920_00985 [Verrucomicrobiae bacterium]|nr:hypothetical protein [Verrucomicrobiae bacterium]
MMALKRQLILLGSLTCCIFGGCAHHGEETFSFTCGPLTFGDVTYYPVHSGTIHQQVVDYTTNPPPAGVTPYVTIITTNAGWIVNCVDGPAFASTNTTAKSDGEIHQPRNRAE